MASLEVDIKLIGMEILGEEIEKAKKVLEGYVSELGIQDGTDYC